VDVNGALRLVALIAVIIGVLVLAAAAFVLSYAGIHAIALEAGVSPRLARLYPLIFDAMLVVASAAVLSLRGAGLVMRCYAWFSLLVLLCAAAWADALHATATRLPHRTAAATVAIVPWALVLLGFGLLLAMLRHARQRRAQAAAAGVSEAAAVPARAAAPLLPVTGQQAPGMQAEPGLRADQAAGVAAGSREVASAGSDVPMSGEPASPAAALPEPATSSWPSVPGTTGMHSQPGPGRPGRHADSQAAELALDADPGNDDPTSDEAHPAGHAARWVPRARDDERPAADGTYTGDYPAPVMSPAPVAEIIPAWDAADEQLADAAREQPRPGAPVQPRHAAPEAGTGDGAPSPARDAGPGPGNEPDQAPAAEAGAGARRQPAPGREVGAVPGPAAEGEAGPPGEPSAERETGADGDTHPADDPAAAPRPGAGHETRPDPEAAAARQPETAPTPRAEGESGGGHQPGTGTALSADSGAGPETSQEGETGGKGRERRAGSEAAAERAVATEGDAPAQGDLAAEQGPADDAGPAPVAPFDRMRSSPVPPDE
jgi:hypothetical protein